MKQYLMAFVALLFSVGMASSATLDFGAEAQNNGERGGSETLTLDGIEVTIGAEGTDSAYLDANSGGKPGGLGVCSSLTAGQQCDPSSDDNISGSEVATVSFSEDVTVNSVEVRDDGHNYLDEGETILVSFDDGATFSQYTVGANGVVDLGDETVVAGTEVQFKRDDASTGSNFYVTTMTVTTGGGGGGGPSPVPLPAALWLLLGGVGILGGIKRFG